MNRGSTLFLKITIFIIGLIVISLSLFWLPYAANSLAEMYPEYAHLRFPILIGIYLTVIPFFIALYHALKLLHVIEQQRAFSPISVNALKQIKYCAITISLIYIIGAIYLITENALHPSLIVIGVTIIFASFVVSVFSDVLQKLLNSALEIKLENDLTV